MPRIRLLRNVMIGLLALAGGALALDTETSRQMQDWARARYGAEAAARVQRWERLSHAARGVDEAEKLRAVNAFFNMVPSVSDSDHWHQQDYWATPLEFLASNGGDCEDFAIAKYFTLRDLGVADERLKITYVKARQAGQSVAHMVLTYYATPDAEPLVLDNLVGAIKPAHERTDLTPLYSFNAGGLWAAKERSLGRRLGPADDIDRWRDLVQRMQQMPH